MASTQSSTDPALLSVELSHGLKDVADRLDGATEPGQFLSAVDAHREVWRRVRDALPQLGPVVPRTVVDFALSSAEGQRRLPNDHRVEALIRLNRQVSRTITHQHQA